MGYIILFLFLTWCFLSNAQETNFNRVQKKLKVKDSILIRSDKLSKKQVLSKMSDYVENHLLTKNV